MAKVVKVAVDSFSGVYTPYQFAAYYKEKMDVKDDLISARLERNDDGEWVMFLHFRCEAHALFLNEIAEHLDCHYVIVGVLTDKTNVICTID